MYKVRFGNFATYRTALAEAKRLHEDDVIDDYYIVRPDSYSVVKHKSATETVRENLVETAETFLGIPYKWGGESPEEGFDCSGLSMVVYKLNGINLPRTSRQQFKTGRSIDRGELQTGDLVFFATGKKRGRVSHVGIYKGNDRFIHAPPAG